MQVPPTTEGYTPAVYGVGGVYVPAHLMPGTPGVQSTSPNPGGPVMQEISYTTPVYPMPYAAAGSSPARPVNSIHDEPSAPVLLSSAKAQEARVDIYKWLRGGWHMYAEYWRYFSGFQLFVFFIDFVLPLVFFLMAAPSHNYDELATRPGQPVPTVSPSPYHEEFYRNEDPIVEASQMSLFSLLTWPLYLGHLFVGLTILRAKVYGAGYNRLDDEEDCHHQRAINDDTDEVKIKFSHFLDGYFLYFPLLALTFVHGMLVFFGFICLIVPGLYLLVVLAFVELLYIEYHHSFTSFDRYSSEPQPFTFWQAFTVSVERVHPQFWRVAGFLIILTLIGYLGAITVIGNIFTIPFTSLCLVIAFEDLFGLRQEKAKLQECIFTCC